MKELLETMPRIELALLIIGAFVLMISIILGYAMINEYKMYLEDHLRARFSLSDFLKRERFYISWNKFIFFPGISFGSNG